MADAVQPHGSITPWSYDGATIRVTPAGQPSVFDMIRVLGGQKNPHMVWERLTRSHPEVVTGCEDLKFPGRGQRKTPVARTKEDAYVILGLLPGAVGRKYREDAAKLFVAYLDNPAGLAESLVERIDQDERDRLEARLNSKRTRSTFSDHLKEAGVHTWGYGRCTNAIYEPVLGADAKTLKQQTADTKGLPLTRVNPRDHMSIKELNDVETAEKIASGQVKRSGAYGNHQVERVVRHSAEFTRKLLDGDISIPGL